VKKKKFAPGLKKTKGRKRTLHDLNLAENQKKKKNELKRKKKNRKPMYLGICGGKKGGVLVFEEKKKKRGERETFVGGPRTRREGNRGITKATKGKEGAKEKQREKKRR